jgi:hypothetical protein
MKSKTLTLVVTFQARPGQEAELRAVLTGMLAVRLKCVNQVRRLLARVERL